MSSAYFLPLQSFFTKIQVSTLKQIPWAIHELGRLWFMAKSQIMERDTNSSFTGIPWVSAVRRASLPNMACAPGRKPSSGGLPWRKWTGRKDEPNRSSYNKCQQVNTSKNNVVETINWYIYIYNYQIISIRFNDMYITIHTVGFNTIYMM